MRIAFYSRVFPPQTGGMERFAQDLTAWLAAQGHDVTVLGPPAVAGSPERDQGVRVVRAPGWRTLLTELARADVVHVNGHSLRGELPTALLAHRPVITHHSYQAVCPTGLAWSSRGPCTADAAHPGPCPSCPHAGRRGQLTTQAHRAAAHLASVNVCISRYQSARMGVPRARIIWDPVGRRAFSAHAPGPGNANLIAFAGRLVEEKGLDVLLRALVPLDGVELEVAGDGPMRAPWEALADQLGVRHRVRFLGAQPFSAVAELYGRAGAVCVPSAWQEPFGYVAAEAMAMGRPVVALPHGALVELLEAGRGFLAADGTAAALSATLRTALGDGVAREAAGAAARRFAQEFLTEDATGSQYLQAYAAGRAARFRAW